MSQKLVKPRGSVEFPAMTQHRYLLLLSFS